MQSIKNEILRAVNKDIKAGINKPVKRALKRSMLSKTVGKLAKNKTLCFSIKANKENCKFAGECKNFCYAKKSFYKMPTVKNAYDHNKNESLKGSFINDITNELNFNSWRYVRIHSAGDFYSKIYVQKWVQIALNNPTKIFYAYTKAMPFFKNIVLPENLLIMQSEGTINDSKLINYNKPFARVFKCKDQFNTALKTGNFIDCTVNDLNCIKAILTGKNAALFLH